MNTLREFARCSRERFIGTRTQDVIPRIFPAVFPSFYGIRKLAVSEYP